MRATWKGNITLGLVNVPIKLITATEDNSVHFHQLHAECRTPINMKRFCAACNQDLEMTDIVKGFPIAGDKTNCVVFTEEDLENLPVNSIHEVELYRTGEMPDPLRLENNYFVSPDKGGEKALSLLVSAMKARKKDGILYGTISLRSKERPCAVWLRNDTVVLSTLRYPDEIRHVEFVPNKPIKEEVDLAQQILDMTRKDLPSTDSYAEAVIEIANKKVSGEDWKPTRKAKAAAHTDLMAQLKQSIAAQKPD